MTAALYALQLLNSMIPLIPAASSLFATFQQNRNALEKMIAEKRDPTPEEWAALDAIRDSLHQQVQS